MRTISVFGATGSIGQSTLDLLRRDADGYDVQVLTGARNIEQLAKDAVGFGAKLAVTADETRYQDLKDALAGTTVEAAAGRQAIVEAAHRPVDFGVAAIVGAAGLEPSLAMARHAKALGLANKESLVCAGALLKATAAESGCNLLPVDSEHSGIFQTLMGQNTAALRRVIITASGGAFRDWPLDDLKTATPAQAATHPNWDMGQRITIDSASMFNKALEVIEAKELFDLTADQIEVVIHPESLIHAMVEFEDRGILAHIGPHDMRHAIGFALNYPTRAPLPLDPVDFQNLGQLTFKPVCPTRHKPLILAQDVMNRGALWGAAFNAAKEVALDRFIATDIGFLDMAHVVDATLDQMDQTSQVQNSAITLENVLATDHLARKTAAAVPV